MNKWIKIISLVMVLGIAVTMCGCSDDESGKKTEQTLDEEKINKEYDEIMSNAEGYNALPEDYNPIVTEFTNTDFQFTWLDNTNAYNLPYNAYTTILPDKAYVNFINSTNEPILFEGTYQNAKGYSFNNTRDEIIASYNVGSDNLYVSENDVCTFGFGSTDGVQYSILSQAEVQTAIQVRSSGANLVESLPSYHTIAIIDLSADQSGLLSEYKMYCYSVETQQDKLDH